MIPPEEDYGMPLDGPCYDYCMCTRCWFGWVKLRLWTRIWWRIQYIIKEGKK